MKTPNDGLGRAPWLWVMAAVFAAQTAGCTKTTTIPPGSVIPPKADLKVYLFDGTTYDLREAHAVEGDICGTPRNCEGPSCTSVMAERCVPKENISTMQERKVDGASIAVASVAATVVAVTALAVVASNSSSSSHSGSSGSGSYGGGQGQGQRSGNIGSCPRIYAWDGASWRLDSGTFGVSYFSAAPRTDFDRLDHLAVDHGKYRLRLVNEQDETEHTDLVRLRVVDHPEGTRIVPSASGKIHTFRNEVGPTIAQDFRGKDARELVTTKDDREWHGDPHGRNADRAEDARDGLRLVFTKPVDAKIAKLRVAAHNTDWAGEMLGYLLSQRGRALPAWFQKMNTDPSARAELVAFLIREGMLNVRVKTPSGWSQRGVFWAAGSEIVKEEAFELSVADIPGDQLEIELESALDFWSIDAVSMAYGSDEPSTVHDLTAAQARTTGGRDVTATLASVDAVRFDTVRGDVAELSFDAPPAPAPGRVRSFVLETNGYYVPEVPPAALANPAAMDALMATPFAASRLALSFRLATLR